MAKQLGAVVTHITEAMRGTQMTGNQLEPPDSKLDPSFTLYVAGQSPSSTAATDNVSQVLSTLGRQMNSVVIVDVLNQPAKALSACLLVAPAFSVLRDGGNELFRGDLRRIDELQGWLTDVLAE